MYRSGKYWHDHTYGLPPEELPRYKEWTVVHQSHTFKVTNWSTFKWWKYKMWGAIRLYIDGQLVDENTTAFPSPMRPVLETDNYSGEGSVRVFLLPENSIWIAPMPLILANEKIIYQPDKWNVFKEKIWKDLINSKQVTP